MNAVITETLLELYRARKKLLKLKKCDPDFMGSLAACRLYWNEVLIEKYLSKNDIAELVDHLDRLNI